MGDDLVGRTVKLLDHRLFHDLHALFDEGLLRKGGDFGIFHGQNTVHHLDHRRIGAQRVEEAGKFNANGARADDKQLFGHMRRLQGVAIGPDALAIGLQPRQFARPRTRGDDNAFGLQLVAALVGFHGNLACARQLGLAHDHGDLVLFQQMADAAGKLLGHPARTFHHRVDVIADLVGRQAKLFGPLHQVEHFGRAQQGFGRDATPVQADAAKVFALDHGNLFAKLGRPDGRDIAARAGTNYHNIENLRCHIPVLQNYVGL